MRISDWSSDVCSSDLREHNVVWLWFQQVLYAKENRLHFCGLLSLIRLQSILLTAPSNGPILRQITQVCGAQSLVLGRKAANYVLYSRTIRRSEEHTSELQSLMRISYAVFCLKKKNNTTTN